MKGYFSSIRSKLAIVLIAGVVPAVMLASMTAAWRETGRRVGAADIELNAIADALAVTISLPLSQGNPQDVTRALRAVGKMPNVRYARVVDAQNLLVAQFGVGIVLAARSPSTEPLAAKSFIDVLDLKDHAFSVPVISGGVRIGRLDLVADVSWLGSAFWSAMKAAILSAIGAAGLGLLIAMPILALVTKPIRALTLAMRRVSETGSYSRVPHPGTRDETGMLVQSFNDMLDEIQTRDSELESQRAGLELAVKDRTCELQVAKQAAEAANAAKTDFLAAMSHEIRTPMHGMLVTTELLQTTPLDDRQKRFAAMITKSGQSLLAIVNDILDLSKIEAGRMEIESIPLQPSVVAEDVVQLFGARAQAKGIGLDLRCAPDVPGWIAGDPVRLNQILSNLVSNAIKFTSKGGVTVEIAQAPPDAPDSGHLRLSVSDTGIGIEQDSLERVFEAFVQASQETSRRFGGTGIGLAICRRLAMAMGGTLTAQSVVGQGSRFTCSIPLSAVAAPVLEASVSDEAVTPMYEGMRVLAADDNPVNRAVLEASLARLGIDVVSVEDGAAAVDAVKTGHFDLVFMDCSMPVMDGYTAARQIRAWEAQQGAQATMPIVALTAHVIGQGSTAWQEAGMSDYLTKPFTLTGLAQVVMRWRKATEQAPAPAPEAAGRAVTAAAPQQAPAVELLNFETIDQVARMDRDGKLMGRLVRLYGEQGRALALQLGALLDTGDRREIGRVAHSLKSMSLSIGAQAVADIVSDLEAAANLGQAIDGPNVASAFSRAFEATLAALDDVVRAKQSGGKTVLQA